MLSTCAYHYGADLTVGDHQARDIHDAGGFEFADQVARALEQPVGDIDPDVDHLRLTGAVGTLKKGTGDCLPLTVKVLGDSW